MLKSLPPRGKVLNEVKRMRGKCAAATRERVVSGSLALISQRAGPLTASPEGEAFFVSKRQHLQQHTRRSADGPEQAGHEKILLPAGVDAPEHSQADARTGGQAGEQAAEADGSLHVELGQQHADRAVGAVSIG